ncbi:MAG: blaR, partial [Planctomycetaceae bacterium]|nr:blaR [Planctomycetaceae bacterium]
MNVFSEFLLSAGFLVHCLNAAVGSLVVCSISVVLSRRTRWSLPVRHALLVGGLAVGLIVPVVVPWCSLPAVWSIQIAGTFDRPQLPSDSPVSGGIDEIEEPRLATSKFVPIAQTPPVRSSEKRTVNTPSVSVEPPVTVVSESIPVQVITERVSDATPHWSRIVGVSLCGIWFVGIVVCLVRAILGLVKLRLWKQTISAVDSPVIDAAACAAAEGVGLRKKIEVCRSTLLPAPVTFGLIWPRVVVPVGIESHLSFDQLRAVIQHEMAHIVRGDLWIGLLQQAAEIVYWWNPVVMLTNRQLADLREQICDDIAIRELPEPGVYAATLISLAERCSRTAPVPATLGIGASPAGQLESRIRRILSSAEMRGVRLTRLATAGVSAVVVLMVATVLLAQVQVKPPAIDKLEEQTKTNPTEPPKLVAPAQESQKVETKPGAAKPETLDESDPFDHPEWGTVEIPGRVVGPDGKPVAGATIFLRKYGVRVPSKKGTTDAEGKFKFTTSRRNGPKLTADR